MIIVYTNCQGQGLIKLLTQHGALAGQQFVHLRAWLKDVPTPTQLASCRVCIVQPAWGKPDFIDQLPAAAQILAIPLLSCALFWPHAFDRPDEPAGWRFPYGDRFIAGRLKSGRNAEQAVDDYFSQDFAKTINLDKLLQLERYKWHRNDQDMSVRLAPFIEANLFSQRLFFTPDHPTDVLLIELANQVLAALGLALFNRPDWTTYRHSLDGVEVPIHSSIARHFGIDWLRPDHLYTPYGGYLSLSHRDYFVSYARTVQDPGWSTACRAALVAMAAGDYNTALNVSALIRLRAPRDKNALALQAVVSALAGQPHQAVRLLDLMMDDQIEGRTEGRPEAREATP